MTVQILSDLGVNVAANIVASFIVGFTALFMLTRFRARGVKKFFGFAPGQSQLKVYLSAIAVQRQGTIATAPIIGGFHGDAMTEIEYRHALRFASSIKSGSASWIITTIFGQRAGAEEVLSTIEKSPSFRKNERRKEGPGVGEVLYDEQAASAALKDQACTVLVGGPIYNLLVHHLLRARPTEPRTTRLFEFIRENTDFGDPVRGIRTLFGVTAEDYVRTEENGILRDYFIVEKISYKGRKVFICAGTCTAATAAAIDKLLEWRHLERKFGARDFGCLYRIYLPPVSANDETRENDPDDATAIELIREYPSR